MQEKHVFQSASHSWLEKYKMNHKFRKKKKEFISGGGIIKWWGIRDKWASN